MGNLMVQMFESHDKSLFELHGFYFGPPLDEKDLLQKRILKCFDSFIIISENVMLFSCIGVDRIL